MKAHDDELECHYLEYLADEDAPGWSDEAVNALWRGTVYGRISDLAFTITEKLKRLA